MKSLAIALAIALAMVTVPAWASGNGSFHALAKVSAASSLTSDELSAVEGGLVLLGPSALTPINVASIGQFLGLVLQQQYGVGPFPLFVTNTTIIPGPAPNGGVSFTPVHRIQPNTLVCTSCFLP